MKLIVGLGNPGLNYARTRHNIGYIYINDYVTSKNLNEKEKFHSKYYETNINDEKIIFLKPLTFMNVSGEAIVEAVNFYKLNPRTDVFVIYDDMDMVLGKLRIRDTGSSGGHNGIKSIIQHIGKEFGRIKVGIGKPIRKEETINYVLGKFTSDEEKILVKKKEIVFNIINDIIEKVDIIKLMNKYNSNE